MLPQLHVTSHTQTADQYPLAQACRGLRCPPSKSTQLLHTRGPSARAQLIPGYIYIRAEVSAKGSAQLLHTVGPPNQICHILLLYFVLPLELTATHMRNAGKGFLNPQLPEVLQVVVQHVLLHVSSEVGPLHYLQVKTKAWGTAYHSTHVMQGGRSMSDVE